MKKILLIGLIALLTVVSLYHASTYTSARAENNISISITNPHGMISLTPVAQIIITQGESMAALLLTNNMAIQIDYRLEYSGNGLYFSPHSGTLTPGNSHEFILSASETCPAGYHYLRVALLAHFSGGRARVNTGIPLQIIAASPPIPEDEDQDDCDITGANGGDLELETGGKPEEETTSGNNQNPKP